MNAVSQTAERSRTGPSLCQRDPRPAPGSGTVSGSTVVAEVGVSVLVKDGHHGQAAVEDPIADGVWEAMGRELALDDLVIVVTKNRRTGVRPSRCLYDGCVDGVQEAVAETALLVLLPGPGGGQVAVDEFVVLDTKAHASRWARRSANRSSISSRVSDRASPVSSIAARRCVSTDHSSSISSSSTGSLSRLASSSVAIRARSWAGSASTSVRRSSAVLATPSSYPSFGRVSGARVQGSRARSNSCCSRDPDLIAPGDGYADFLLTLRGGLCDGAGPGSSREPASGAVRVVA